MRKTIKHDRTKFGPEVIDEALTHYEGLLAGLGEFEISDERFEVRLGSTDWKHDNIAEFFADYRQEEASGYLERHYWNNSADPYVHCVLRINLSSYKSSEISVDAPNREVIESVLSIFEKHLPGARLPDEPQPDVRPTIFIGHGHSPLWRDLKDHLHEQHGYPVEAYETGARAGHAIRDILQEMAAKSSFALLVLTAEDLVDDDKYRARQNAVHETGLFQGRLGFPRAIVLKRGRC